MWDKLTPAQRLMALYNKARTQGMSILHYKPGDLDELTANAAVGMQKYFDYFHGRVLKVDVFAAEPSFHLYDRDNGQGAGERAIREFAEKL